MLTLQTKFYVTILAVILGIMQIEKYNNNNLGRFHTLTVKFSNGIELVSQKKKIKRTEEVYVDSNAKCGDMLFNKLNPVIIGIENGYY